MYNLLLYSHLKGIKATGLGKDANLYMFPCELGDTDENFTAKIFLNDVSL